MNTITTLTMTPDERKQLAEDLEVAMNAVVPNWDVVRRLRRLQEKLA